MNSNRGITLVVLIITIIVLLILAGTATTTGINVMNNGRRTAFVTELQMIQEKAKYYREKGQESYQNLGQVLSVSPVTQEQKKAIQTSTGLSLDDNYRYFSKDTYSQIDLDGIKKDTLVNFQTGQVVSVRGIKINGVKNYILSQLGEEQYEVPYVDKTSGKINFSIYPQIDTSNFWTFIVDSSSIEYPENTQGGVLHYRKNGNNYWDIATSLSFTAREPGIYETKIVDKAGNESDIKPVYAYVKAGLILYYDGENNTPLGHDTSAKTWTDLSGNGHDGTLSGFAQTSASGWKDSGLKFDGTDDYVTNTSQDFVFDGDFTIQVTGDYTGGSNSRSLISKWNGRGSASGLTQGYWIGQHNGGMSFGTYPDGYKTVASISSKDMFTMTRENNIANFYTKAIKQDSTEISTPLGDDVPLYIGQVNTLWLYDGEIQRVQIYNRALSGEEIAVNHVIDQVRFSI